MEQKGFFTVNEKKSEQQIFKDEMSREEKKALGEVAVPAGKEELFGKLKEVLTYSTEKALNQKI